MKFDVQAVLSATDRGFKSAMREAKSSVSGLKDAISGGLGFGILVGAGQAAFNAISGSVMGLGKEVLGTSDSMAKLQQAMRFSGVAESEISRIAGLTGTLKTYADKTVFDLNDVMGTFGALTANGISDADKMTESLGNAIAVFGGGKREFQSIGLAFSQAMAAGSLHAQDWNQILNASPQLAGGLRKELMRLNPALEHDFKGAMEKGAISADLLGQAMNNIGMTDAAKAAAQSVTTFEGAMGNLEAAVSSGMLTLYDSFAKAGVVDVINKMTDGVSKGFDFLAAKLPGVIEKIKPYWDAFADTFNRVKSAFSSAVSKIAEEVQKLTGSFGSTESVDAFKSVLDQVGDSLSNFAGFLERHREIIAKLIANLPKIVAAYMGFKIIKPLVPFVAAFGAALAKMAGKAVAGLAGRLFGISRGQQEVGQASIENSQAMFTAAKSFLAIGGAFLMISVGFYILSQAAVSVANAGPAAIAVLFGLVGAIGLLGFGMTAMLKTLAPLSSQLAPLSVLFLAIGGTILMISTGFYILAQAAVSVANAGPAAIAVLFGLIGAIALLGIGMTAMVLVLAPLSPVLGTISLAFLALGASIVIISVAFAILAATAIQLAAAGWPAIAVMFGLIGAVALLAAGAAILGPALTAGAVGFLAFGAAMLMIGTAIAVAAPGLAALPPVVEAVGTAFATAAVGVGNAVATILDGVSQVIESIGNGLRTVLDGIAGVFDSIGNAALNAGKGLKLAASGIKMIADIGIVDLGKTMVALGDALTTLCAHSSELQELGNGMQQVADAMAQMPAGVAAFANLSSSITSAGNAMQVMSGNFSTFSGTLTDLGASVVTVVSPFRNVASASMSLSAALLGSVAGVVAFAGSLTNVTSMAMMAAAALAALGSGVSAAGSAASTQLQKISGSAKMAQSALMSMPSAMSAVTSGLSTMGAKAKSTMLDLLSTFTQTAAQARNAGQKVGVNFSGALSPGLAAAVAQSSSASSGIVSRLSAAQSGAYSSGMYIGLGLANGMRSMLGTVWAVAAQLAAAADRAIVAKAKIGSPSRVAIKNGGWIGKGLGLGIKGMIGYVGKMGTELFDAVGFKDFPQIQTVFAGGIDMDVPDIHDLPTSNSRLNSAWDYGRGGQYTIEVPLSVDGRSFARATAEYTQEELNRKTKLRRNLTGQR